MRTMVEIKRHTGSGECEVDESRVGVSRHWGGRQETLEDIKEGFEGGGGPLGLAGIRLNY